MLRRLLIGALLAAGLLGGSAFAQSNDFSGLITLGGTSQVAITAKPAGQIIFVQNPSVETETLWVNFGAVAAEAVANVSGESIALLPGGSISLATTQSVNVVASDTDHVFVAKTLSLAGLDNPGGGGAGGAGDASAANQTTGNNSLGVMDDWDETDRAKVNPIVGQAGIAAGAGAVSALTTRTITATDDLGVASLSVVDDWDETDRAKVNLVAGQAGITAGAGAVAANTPRVTHASDDPAVASLQIIDNLSAQTSATFTPAAASHTAGDVNGAAAEFALAGPSGTVVMIASAILEIESATAEASAWRLCIYDVTPPSALADDAVWDLPSGDIASNLGCTDLGTAVDLGSTQRVETHGINKPVKLSGTSLFGYLVNLTTLTPAAVVHRVKLYTVPF